MVTMCASSHMDKLAPAKPSQWSVVHQIFSCSTMHWSWELLHMKQGGSFTLLRAKESDCLNNLLLIDDAGRFQGRARSSTTFTKASFWGSIIRHKREVLLFLEYAWSVQRLPSRSVGSSTYSVFRSCYQVVRLPIASQYPCFNHLVQW